MEKKPKSGANSSPFETPPSSSNTEVRRSGRKRKVKQFEDYEVDFPLGEKEMNSAELRDEINHKNKKQKPKCKRVSDVIKHSEAKSGNAVLEQSTKGLHTNDKSTYRKESKETFKTQPTKPLDIQNAKQKWSKAAMKRVDFSCDLSSVLTDLGKQRKILYKCLSTNCTKSFDTIKSLELHKIESHGEKIRHVCTECDKCFRSIFLLQSHVRMEHSNVEATTFQLRNVDVILGDKDDVIQKIYICTSCGYRYGNHEDPSHECEPTELRYFCPCCDFECMIDADMQLHMSENHKGEYREIKDKGKYLDLRSAAREPAWNVGQNETNCDVCRLKCETTEALKQHMNTKHAHHPFACGVCKTCYGRKPALKNHMVSHRLSNLHCEVCRKECSDKNRLAIHKLTHTGERPHQCEICGNRYCDESAVKKHIARKHSATKTHSASESVENYTELTVVCDICGKTFTSMALLNKHCKMHKKSEIFKCPKCNLMFDEVSSFKQHKLSHLTLDFSKAGLVKSIPNKALQQVFNEIIVYDKEHESGNPYQCSICNKQFNKVKCAHRHMRLIHMKEEDKRFICHICKKGFTMSAALRTHMRMHTKSKPYQCKICDKKFRQLGHVKDHLLHHGTPHLQCALCKMKFKSRGSLRRHVKVHCKIQPFKCPVGDCLSAFLSLYPFLAHLSSCLESTEAGTVLECSFCNQEFNKAAIESHYHEHERDMKFPCEVCNAMFDNYPKLYFHKEAKNHFVESEYEPVANYNFVNRQNLREVDSGLDREDLLSQFVYNEEDNDDTIEVANAMLENSSTSMYVEQSTVDDDGELILIAEQLTNMASGVPYPGVIVHTSENLEDGTVTEITIEEVNEEQVVSTEQIVEQEYVGQTDGQVIVEGTINGDQNSEISVTLAEQDNITCQKHTVVCQNADQVSNVVEIGCAGAAVEVSPNMNPDSVMAEQQVLEHLDAGDNSSSSITNEATKLPIEMLVDTNIEVETKMIEENDMEATSVIASESLKDKSIESMSKTTVTQETTTFDKDSHSEKLACDDFKQEFSDEHFCDEVGEGQEMTSDSEYEVKVKKKRGKRKYTNKKRTAKVNVSSDLSAKLKDLFKNGGFIYECKTGKCPKRFFTFGKLCHHKKLVHKEISKHICSLCDKRFGSVYVFKSHIRMEHSDRHAVPIVIKNANIVIEDKRNVIGTEVLVCTKCGYRYGNLEDPTHDCKPVQLHYYCPSCAFFSANQTEIGKHIAEIHKGDVKPTEIQKRYTSLRSEKKEPGFMVGMEATACDTCDMKFDTNEHLKEHMNTKHADHPFACGVCQSCYGRKTALTKHMLTHRNLNLKCDVCDKEFSEKTRLETHKLTHTGEKPHQCEVCGNRYCDEKTVRKHMMIKHLDHYKSCYPDRKISPNLGRQKVTKSSSICHLCGMSFQTEFKLNKHLHRHKTQDLYMCPHCDQTFNEIMVFKKHKMTHETLDLCTGGGVKGVTDVIKEYKVYEEGHPSGLSHRCGVCDKRFTTVKCLNRHIRITHLKEEDKGYVCQVCKRGFTMAAALRTHMRLHVNTKPFKCRICYKQFRQLGHIKDHLLHHGKPHLKCTLCKKMFKSKGNLRRHLSIHCKIFPFKCPVNGCKAAFKSLFPFLNHCSECFESIGTEELLVCSFCKKHFSAGVIRSHYHSHENDVKFPCEKCGMSFRNYHHLFLHKDQMSHFADSEFETLGNTRGDMTQDLNKDGPGDLDKEELLNQYDYIVEEDCTFKSLENIDEEEHREVEEIIENENTVVLNVDQLKELTSGVVSEEVIFQQGWPNDVKTEEVVISTEEQGVEPTNLTQIALSEDMATTSPDDLSVVQDLLNSVGTLPDGSQVYAITKPSETDEVTYYILTVDQAQA